MPNATAATITPIQDSFSATSVNVPEIPGVSSLRVSGLVECPTPHWQLSLEPAAQNSSPSVLTLDLVALHVSDMDPQVQVKLSVAFEQSPPPAGVTQVEIRYGGTSFTVPVQTAAELLAAKAAATQAAADSAVAALKA